MSGDKTYYVELIGQLANVNAVELRGGEEVETSEIRVRGKVRHVTVMSKFEVETILKSADHKDNVRVYSQVGDEAPRLEYPRKKPILPADYRARRNREIQQEIADTVSQASAIRNSATSHK